MYELFVDNQRFFRRYFSLSDLAEDKKSTLEGCSSRGGRGRGDSGIALSQLVFGAVFALWGATCGSLAKIVEKTILEIFLFQLVLPSHFGQEIFCFHPKGETPFTQHFFSVVRTRFLQRRGCRSMEETLMLCVLSTQSPSEYLHSMDASVQIRDILPPCPQRGINHSKVVIRNQ